MNDLIAALQIFAKYGNPTYPTHCEHDTLYVCIEYSKVSEEDCDTLRGLGFFKGIDTDGFMSHKFGSA